MATQVPCFNSKCKIMWAKQNLTANLLPGTLYFFHKLLRKERKTIGTSSFEKNDM